MIYRVLPAIPFALLSLCTAVLVSAAASGEPASVKVDLSDQGGHDRILLSPAEVKQGPVEFHIKNTSKTQMHEFLLAPWKGSITSLPYNAKEGEVAEGKISDLAGVEDMKPGAQAILRLPLKPGRYVAFCDQPGHYKAGMEARFTVKK